MAEHGGDQPGVEALKIPLQCLWGGSGKPLDFLGRPRQGLMMFCFFLSEAAGMVVDFLVLELGTDLPGLLWLVFKEGWT